MKYFYLFIIASVFLLFPTLGCGGKAKPAKEDSNAKVPDANATVRSALSADDLIRIYDCDDASCVQLFMKNYTREFIYGKKGEFASVTTSVLPDSTGTEVTIPLSTLYFSTDPGADWRLTQTVHHKDLSDELLNEFVAKKFTIIDSFFYHATKAICYRYTSPDYPKQTLYFSKTYSPWGSKGLYLGSTWLCYVFEIKREN